MIHSLTSLGTLVTIDEVAQFFRCHRKTIDKWHKTRPDFPRKLELADGSKRFLLSAFRRRSKAPPPAAPIEDWPMFRFLLVRILQYTLPVSDADPRKALL